MNALNLFWHFNLSSAIILIILIFVFVWRKSFSAQTICSFLLLLLVYAICFISPLQILSAHYLMWAHMVVHILLLLVLGPLLLFAFPSQNMSSPAVFIFLQRHPITGWLAGIGMMWFWHVPVVFNSVMNVVHEGGLSFFTIIEDIGLIGAGILFSAPVIYPDSRCRVDALSGIVYLFTACIGCSILGLLITFAPPGTYQHFLSRHDVYGLNKMIVEQWGITQSVDQQAAGLIMWVPCCFIYLAGALYLLTNWLSHKKEINIQLKRS